MLCSLVTLTLPVSPTGPNSTPAATSGTKSSSFFEPTPYSHPWETRSA